jgi:hypothetical protein
MRKSSVLYLSLLASVAACSSGGGGSNSAGVATVTNPPPGNIATFSSGTSTDAQVVGFSYQCAADPCGAGAATSTRINNNAPTSSVALTNDGAGNVTSMTLNINEGGANLTHTFDLTTAVGAAQDGFLEKTETPGGADPNQYDVIFAGSADATHSLTYVTYGLWSQTNQVDANAQGGYGAFVAGNVTPTANMPITGSATYSGTAIGQLSPSSGGYDILSGTMTASANFATRTVNGSMSLNANGDNIANATNSGFWNTVTWNQAVIAGNHFAGTVSAPATGVNSVIASEAMQGNVAGAFYGPQANEIGGAFNLAGANGSTSLGAFGGKK